MLKLIWFGDQILDLFIYLSNQVHVENVIYYVCQGVILRHTASKKKKKKKHLIRDKQY